MDQFYQELRKIQKKERNNGTLARVEEDFYASIHEYLDDKDFEEEFERSENDLPVEDDVVTTKEEVSPQV